jgi:hypothetical protein
MRRWVMAWIICKYAPVMQEVVRQGMIARLAATIDPPPKVGRPWVWSTLVMLWTDPLISAHRSSDTRLARKFASAAPARMATARQ